VCRVAGDLDMATMTISDNGNGFKVSAEDKRHGLGLVRRLVEQVREPRWSTRTMARFG
jgi:signal transduction histidine kinase